MLRRILSRSGARRRASPAASGKDLCSLRIVHAYGGHVVDEDGVDHIDLVSGWGSNILGYGHPRVARAVAAQIARWSNLGTGGPEYGRLQALLGRHVPCAEAIHLMRNGSDATGAAVRLARAVTGRERVLHRGYHGVHDWSMAETGCPGVPARLGPLVDSIPALTARAVAEALRRRPREYACLIVDPILWPIPEAEEVREIQQLVRDDGALLVFDEIVSGFRVAPGGMQAVWGVTPDLACLGKAIANGSPISVLAGSARLMARVPSIQVSLTFGCESVSIVAAIETIQEIAERGVCDALARKGRTLKARFAAAAATRGIASRLSGHDSRPILELDEGGALRAGARRENALRALAREGICTYGTFNLCAAHDDADLARVSRALERALDEVAAEGGACATS